jgi:S1-C subfamily serine protease
MARRSLLAPFVALVLLVPSAGTASAAPPARRPAPAAESRRGAALPVLSDLLRDTGLADLLNQLLQGPLPQVGPLPGAVVSRVTASTVKVSSVACGYRIEGSGFSAAADTVVTNAHVVAGATGTQVQRPDGRRLPAQVQVFDPDRDLAVLAVPGLSEQPLPLNAAEVGGTAAVFGHPQGQVPVEVSPATVVRKVTATTTDIYGEEFVRRPILVLAAGLEPGDSGAPLVNESGDVVGVAFAISRVRATTAFAIPSETLAPVLAQPRAGAVSTGPCVD